MSDWPNRSARRGDEKRVVRVSRTAIKRLPVTAAGPKILPQPTLTPRSRQDAFVATLVYVPTILLLLALLTYSVARFQVVALTGKFFVGTIIGMTVIALCVFVIGLGLYVLPVMFGVRKPAPTPPPAWPGIGDRH